MFLRLSTIGLGILFAAVASAADPATAGGPSGQKTNPNLAGKTSYTTDAIILENEYVKAVVLPEFG